LTTLPATSRRLAGATNWAHAWELLLVLTRRELKLRYQDTLLGFVWTLLRPLLLSLVLYFALGRVLDVGVDDYHLFLLSALFPWTWLQTSVTLATGSFVGNGPLLKKVRFPRVVLPFSIVLFNLVHFVLSVPILLVLLAAAGYEPDWVWLIGLPFLALVELALLFGLVLIVASLTVFMRDLEHLVEVFFTLLFYVTPVLYPVSRVPDGWGWVMKVNPAAPLVEGWRSVFMANDLPSADIWITVAYALVALLAGGWLYHRLKGQLADAL
jgi:ABC-type polysaccharide/polyol phosphate export permease